MAEIVQNSTSSSKILSESAGGQGEVCEMQNRPLPELRLQPSVADQFCKGPDGEASVQLGFVPRHDAGYFPKLVQELIPSRAAIKAALAFAAGDLRTAFKNKTDYSAETIEGFFNQRCSEVRNLLGAGKNKVKEAEQLLKQAESGLQALRRSKEIVKKFSYAEIRYLENELAILAAEIKKAKGEDIASSFLKPSLDASISQFPDRYEFYLQRARASYRVFGDAAAAYRDFREAESKSRTGGASEQERSAILAETRAFLLTHARASHEAKNYQAAAEYYGLAVKGASDLVQQREILLELKLFQQELRSLLPETENLLNDAMHQNQIDVDLAGGLAKQRVAILGALGEIAKMIPPDGADPKTGNPLLEWSEQYGQLLAAQELDKSFDQAKAEHAVVLQLNALVEQGYLADVAKFPEIAAFVGLTTVEGKTRLQFSEGYQDLSYEKKLEVLRVLGAIGQLGQMKAADANPETPPLQKGYFAWKIDLAESRVEAAKIKMVDFKAEVQAKLAAEPLFLEKNPEIAAGYEECREQLRTFTLLAIEKLKAHNSALLVQRLTKLGIIYEKQDARLNEGFLSYLKSFVKEEKADTLEEALAFMKNEHQHSGKYAEFVGTYGQWTNIKVRDPDFQNLFNMETREAWQQMDTPEKRREYLLAQAKDLDSRHGSRKIIAVDIAIELMQGSLKQAIAEIPEGEKRQIVADLEQERPQAAKEIQRQLDQFKKDRPYEFTKRFPEGKPSDAEFQAMVAENLKGKLSDQLMEKAAPKIDSWAEHWEEENNPLSHDPVAREAWHLYDRFKDPLDRPFQFTADTWDTIIDEAIISVATLPLTMGVGSAVRAGVGATTLIRGLAARGGMRWLASEALVLGSGSAAESLTLSAVHGNFSLKSFGIQMLMTGAFHVGGRGWAQVANKFAIGEEAMKAAIREGKSIIGLKVVNFAGMAVTQTALSVAFDYAQEFATGNDSGLKLFDRIMGHGARQVGFGFGSKSFQKLSGGVFHEAEQRAKLACDIAAKEYRRLLQTGMSPDEAYAKALALSKAMVPQIWAGPSVGQVEQRYNPRSSEGTIFEQFVAGIRRFFSPSEASPKPSLGDIVAGVKVLEPILTGLRCFLELIKTPSTENLDKVGPGQNQPGFGRALVAGVNGPMMVFMGPMMIFKWLFRRAALPEARIVNEGEDGEGKPITARELDSLPNGSRFGILSKEQVSKLKEMRKKFPAAFDPSDPDQMRFLWLLSRTPFDHREFIQGFEVLIRSFIKAEIPIADMISAVAKILNGISPKSLEQTPKLRKRFQGLIVEFIWILRRKIAWRLDKLHTEIDSSFPIDTIRPLFDTFSQIVDQNVRGNWYPYELIQKLPKMFYDIKEKGLVFERPLKDAVDRDNPEEFPPTSLYDLMIVPSPIVPSPYDRHIHNYYKDIRDVYEQLLVPHLGSWSGARARIWNR